MALVCPCQIIYQKDQVQVQKKEFIQFLNIARRSTFENANILIILERRKLITRETLDVLLDDLDKLCRQITNFQKTLR